MRTFFLLSLLLSAVAFGGEGGAFLKASNAFGTDSFDQLRAQKGNCFFSPASIETALAMTMAGAKGKTADELAAALHIEGDSKAFHESYREWLESLEQPGDDKRQPFRLVMANSFWAQKGIAFLPDFTELLKKSYGAMANTVDFHTDANGSRTQINKWVEEQTQGRIADLLSPTAVDASTRLVLVDAIYFKGGWVHPFSSGLTHQQDFFVEGGRTTKAPMMRQKQLVPYLESPEMQAVSIPYRGNSLAMVIFLPKGRDGIAKLEKNFTEKNVEEWASALHGRQVNLVIPKFRFSSDFSLASALNKLGVKLAFSPQADLSAMTGEKGLYLSDVVHKAYVDVNEEGTEAAGATASLTFGSVMVGPPPATFIADHPFLFVIRDMHKGVNLFMGRVSEPSAPVRAR